VFLLREVFGYAYPEIAEVTGKTEAACRQIFARARRRIDEAAWVNGQPGLLASDADGGLIAVISLDVLDGQVQAIRTVANPEKLSHLGPLSQVWHLRSDR
jgi:predicted transcriptional regulator